MQPRAAAQPQQSVGEHVAACREMGLDKLRHWRPAGKEAAGKIANGQVKCEGGCLLEFGLSCLSLESMAIRHC